MAGRKPKPTAVKKLEGRFFIWEIKIVDQSHEMDILDTEQEILSLFDDLPEKRLYQS